MFYPCSVAIFVDSLSALQLIQLHRPRSHHSIIFSIHLLLHQLVTSGYDIHLQWVPSHIGVVGNSVADRAAAGAHSHPSPIDLPTDLTDFLTALQATCFRYWTGQLTDSLRSTHLGDIRHDTRPHWWTHSPCRALDTTITRLRIGHSRLRAHLHRLGLADNPYCPWCPTQLDTPEHVLLFCPRHHSHRVALMHSLNGLNIRRPTLAQLLGGSLPPDQAFKVLKQTRAFLQRTGQLRRI